MANKPSTRSRTYCARGVTVRVGTKRLLAVSRSLRAQARASLEAWKFADSHEFVSPGFRRCPARPLAIASTIHSHTSASVNSAVKENFASTRSPSLGVYAVCLWPVAIQAFLVYSTPLAARGYTTRPWP